MQAEWVTPYVLSWVERSTAVSILHLFDHVCNVVNTRREVVSIVSDEIGCGPFSIVVPRLDFSGMNANELEIRIDNDKILLNDLTIKIDNTVVWQPQPNWTQLQSTFSRWQIQLPRMQQMCESFEIEVVTHMQQKLLAQQGRLIDAIKQNDVSCGREAIRNLAGLGNGLTPAGDDFLMGVLFGLRATSSPELADLWGDLVIETAVSRTTTLSAAWLKAAARGEATAQWHHFLNALEMDDGDVETAVNSILAIGHSSGYDALSGFLALISHLN